MRDILEITNEANEKGKDEKQITNLFAEYLLDELRKMKGTDISQYLSCELDIIKQQYVITLKLPIAADIFNSVGSESK